MKKYSLLFVIIFFISSNLLAQTTFFDSLVLNGLDVNKKIEIYLSLIGKPIPFNYELSENGFYIYDRRNNYGKDSDLKKILEETHAIAESEDVSFIAENGIIKVVRIFKLFDNKDDFEEWWIKYYLAITYTGECTEIKDGVLKKGNKIIQFDILSEEEMAKLIIIDIKKYFSCIYFFEKELL